MKNDKSDGKKNKPNEGIIRNYFAAPSLPNSINEKVYPCIILLEIS